MTDYDATDPELVSEIVWRELAKNNPQRLLDLIASGRIPEHRITFALESAGYIESIEPSKVADVVMPFLDHAKAVVREGAIYGLNECTKDERVRGKVAIMAASDPSPAIRQCSVAYLSAD